MAGFLKKIKEKDLVLNEKDTKAVLTLFLPQRADEIKRMEINNNHRALAQGLLIEAADASKKLEVMKVIAEYAYGHNPKKLINILDAVTKAAEVIYEYKKPTEISIKLINDSELSQQAIDKIRLNFKNEIDMVLDNNGGIYLDSKLKQDNSKNKFGFDINALEEAKHLAAQQKTNQRNI